MCQNMGIGAQFGGKYFCHDVRVVRLPRHGASCPIGIGVSCSADRQVGSFYSILLLQGFFSEQLFTKNNYLFCIFQVDLLECQNSVKMVFISSHLGISKFVIAKCMYFLLTLNSSFYLASLPIFTAQC